MRHKRSSDIQKANALRTMAEISLQRLNQTQIKEYPSNSLVDYYDIIHKLLDSFFLKNGWKFSGDSAHYELIQASKEVGLNDQEIQLVQQMREYRNRIQYEGFHIQREYIQSIQKDVEKIISRLMTLLNK